MRTGVNNDRKIAVIGVHGVGDQVAGATAAAIATLLEVQHGERYPAFTNHALKIPVSADGLRISTDNVHSRAGFNSVFHKRGDVFPGVPADIAFTASLLAGNTAFPAQYGTSFWHGQNCGKDGDTQVDIYELYWSDLSHGNSSSSYAIFGQFMQLVVHLASLGRTVAATVLPHVPDARRRRWTRFYRLNAVSYWLLSMPVLIGNLWLVLLGALFVAVNAAVPRPEYLIVLSGICFGIEITAACFCLFYRWWEPMAATSAFLPGAVAGWEWVAKCNQYPSLSPVSLPLFLALSLGGYYVMAQYQVMRPSAVKLYWVVGALMIVAATALMFWLQPQYSGNSPFLEALFVVWVWYACEVLFVGLLICGTLFLVANVALLLGGIWIVLAAGAPEDKAERVSAITCMATALLPGPLFGGLVLWFWTMVGISFRNFPGSKDIVGWAWIRGWPRIGPYLQARLAALMPGAHSSWTQFSGTLIDGSARLGFLYYDVALCVGLIFTGAVLVPSVLAEFFPPSLSAQGNSKIVIKLGDWLDGVFLFLGVVAALALIVFLGAFAVNTCIVLWTFWDGVLPHWVSEISVVHLGLLIVGVSGGGAVLGYLAATKALSGTLSDTFTRMRVLVDTILDVDNWLRERPQGNTMRLHVFTRFASLLRYLKSQGYQEAVVVAHSQGTVITADLLKYLQYLYGPEEVEEPAAGADLSLRQRIRLLTMGCPLRQLYAWRMPILYDWAGEAGKRFGEGPKLEKLGLRSWDNAYGSGDYIGRNLWPNGDPYDPTSMSSNAPANCRDICIGPIAHTHYLDESNKMIADCVDGLIWQKS